MYILFENKAIQLLSFYFYANERSPQSFLVSLRGPAEEKFGKR